MWLETKFQTSNNKFQTISNERITETKKSSRNVVLKADMNLDEKRGDTGCSWR
jgi:hypothetical protein